MDNFFAEKKRPLTPAKWFYFMQSNRVFDTEIYTFDSFKFWGVPPNRIFEMFLRNEDQIFKISRLLIIYKHYFLGFRIPKNHWQRIG